MGVDIVAVSSRRSTAAVIAETTARSRRQQSVGVGAYLSQLVHLRRLVWAEQGARVLGGAAARLFAGRPARCKRSASMGFRCVANRSATRRLRRPRRRRLRQTRERGRLAGPGRDARDGRVVISAQWPACSLKTSAFVREHCPAWPGLPFRDAGSRHLNLWRRLGSELRRRGRVAGVGSACARPG